MNITICWLGTNDLELSLNDMTIGPVASFYKSSFFQNTEKLYILSSHSSEENDIYKKKLNDPKVEIISVELNNPTDYNQIYFCVINSIQNILKNISETIQWSFFISSGTSQMTTIWVLLSQTEYEAKLFQTEIESNTYVIKESVIPFSIKTEYIANFLKKSESINHDNWKTMPVFSEILHQSKMMKVVLQKTYTVSLHEIPVLILGETGTGKELIAKAIHSNSARKNKAFSIINCAALPESIADSLLFGYSKGAFTDANHDSQGIFEKINDGTLFLDEIGDLSVQIQVKILRVIETGEFQRLGDMKKIKTDVRLICATHKNIYNMIHNNEFREDLFYRISTAIINLPPLRSREMDASYIAIEFVKLINKELKDNSIIYKTKTLDKEAIDFISKYKWPGNIRELYHTLKRCCIFTTSSQITKEQIKQSILPLSKKTSPSFPLNLEKRLSSIKSKYINKALLITKGNKTKAAELLGYKNYQSIDYFINQNNYRN